MAIELKSTSINNSSVSANRQEKRQIIAQARQDIPKPARAHVNYVPSNESLKTLIANATFALRQGVYWDRGSIVNLLL